MSSLDSERLHSIRERLLQRDRDLRAEIDATRLGPEEVGAASIVGSVRDSGEESVATLEQDLNRADVARDVAELNDISAALARLRDGEYGVCETCAGEIAPARLEAQPTARRCIRCQALHEKTYAGTQAPTL